MQAGTVTRELDGVDLLDIDINNRRPAWKEKQTPSGVAYRVMDWVCTTAPATELEALVRDPLEQLSLL